MKRKRENRQSSLLLEKERTNTLGSCGEFIKCAAPILIGREVGLACFYASRGHLAG